MLNNSLFVCYSTPNYSRMTNIFLNSLKEINIKNIEHLLDNTKICNNNLGFQSEIWYYSIRNKINHLINILNKDNKIKYYIFTDCDIVYIKENINEWDNLEKYIINKDKDIFFMRENLSNDVNTGFFIIKNNDNINNIIKFFIKVLDTIDKTKKEHMPLGDQTIINNLKNEINYDYIPNNYVIFGTNIFNKKKSLFHHAVCCKNIDEKIKQINIIKNKFKINKTQNNKNMYIYLIRKK